MLTGVYYGIVENTKTRVRCVFCGVYIPKANKCIEEHINGVKHKENMQIVNENGISFIVNEGLYCKLCDIFLPDKQTIVQHLQTESHANWLATLDDLIDGEYIRVEGFLASQTPNAYCQPCQTSILCTLQNIEEHINKSSHHESVAQSIKPLNALFPVYNREELWCKICDLYLEDTMPAILDHIDNNVYHVEWINKMEDYMDQYGIFIGNYLAHEFENKAYCLRCRAEILCSYDSIDYHVQTEAHITSDEPNLSEIKNIMLQPYVYALTFTN